VYGNVAAISGVLYGFKAAVIVLVLAAIQRIGKRAIRSVSFALVALLALGMMNLAIPFPAILLTAGLIGFVASRLSPTLFPPPKKAAHGAGGKAAGSPSTAFIDDDTPTPPHARVDRRKIAIKVCIFTVLLFGPLIFLEQLLGHDHIFSRMGRFFVIAAFSTIGGAYAVLPYVTEMSTRVYGWLRPGQMMDGLALGETTPGPLILVLTFVGFVGAWNITFKTMGYAGSIVGCAIATYFTFLPSFLFILIGGPYVERTRNEFGVGAVLSCVTAAVVGAVINMELFFSAQYIFPQNTFDPKALILIVLAALAMFWRKWEAMPVIGACGAIGILEYALRALHWIP
jgi:chromate transporter